MRGLSAATRYRNRIASTVTAITLNFTAFAVGAPTGTVVGVITPTFTGGAPTLTITGTNSTFYAVSGNNLITTAANPALATTHSINITDGTFVQPFTIYCSATTTLPESTNYAPGGLSYMEYLAVYNADTHTQSALIYNASFPDNVIYTANYAGAATPAVHTIFGYSGTDYGNYQNTTVAVPVTPAKLFNITTLTVDFNFTWSTPVNAYNGLLDFWLSATPFPSGGQTTLDAEIEIFFHSSQTSIDYVNGSVQLGTFADGLSGITWKVAHDTGGNAGNDYLFAPASPVAWADVKVGSIDLRAMLNFLTTCSIPLPSAWYYNGHFIGCEALGSNSTTYTFTSGHNHVNYVIGANNLLTAPTDFSNAAWIKNNVTITNAGAANQALIETTATGLHNVRQNITLPSAIQTYQYQFDATAPATSGLVRAFAAMEISILGASGITVEFNLSTGAIGGSNFAFGDITLNPANTTITSLGSGVFRCVAQFTTSNADSNCSCFLEVGSATGVYSYAGNASDGARITNASLTRIA